MINWQQIQDKLRKIYFSDKGSDDRSLHGMLTYLVRYLFHIVGELTRDQCFLRAAALTFTTVMTLIPILVLLFVTFRAFGGLQDANQHVQEFLFQHMLPESVASIQSYIHSLVADFNSQAVSFISILFLIGSAYALFSSVDSSLNVIWGTHKARNIFNRLVTIWFLLTVTPLLLGYSLYLTARLQTFSALDNAVLQSGVSLARRLTPYFLSMISLTLMYKLVPRKRVQWRSAILGGCVAAIFFELTKYGFNYYVQNLANYKLLYGSFLTLPIFLIWVDLSWLIILAGAEVAFTHQYLDRLHLIHRQRESAMEDNCQLPDKLGIYLYSLIVESFFQGKSVTRSGLRVSAAGQTWMIDTLLDRFQNAGMIVIDQEGRVLPSKDPSRTTIAELYEFFEPEEDGEYFRHTGCRSALADALLSGQRQHRNDWAQTINLRDFLVTNQNDKVTGGKE